jgi:bifunctional non-homologous end joining protein LigD
MATRSKKAKESGKKPAGLSDCARKRDFKATPEPGPTRRRRKKAPPRFVIQEHSARRLHWDLRLEHDGVAASWVIPNGIPDDPSQNRKAVHTEDHPLEYLEFEGEIPKGEYGAGTMRIFDRGTYELEKWEAEKVMVRFEGERVKGRYALFRRRGRLRPESSKKCVPMPASFGRWIPWRRSSES